MLSEREFVSVCGQPWHTGMGCLFMELFECLPQSKQRIEASA